MNFNPVLLGYATPLEFRFESPIAGELDCDRVVYIFPDMNRDDVEEAFISCLPSVLGGEGPLVARFHGYSSDPRPICEIDRVLEQSKWIVEVGGISVLDVFPSMTSGSAGEVERAFSGVGAFEIWLISKGLIKEAQGKTLGDLKPVFDEFWDDLMISNANSGTNRLEN